MHVLALFFSFFLLSSCNPLKPSGTTIPEEYAGFVDPVSSCSWDQFAVNGTRFEAGWVMAPFVERYRLVCESESKEIEICKGLKSSCMYEALQGGKDYVCMLTGENPLNRVQCGSIQSFKAIGAFEDQGSSVSHWSQITLRWTEAVGASSYKVEEVDGEGRVLRLLSQEALMPFVVSGLQAETTYRFKVTARNATNYRQLSSMQLTTGSIENLALENPTVVAPSSLRFSWTLTGSVSEVVLLMKEANSATFSPTSCTSNPCTLSSLTPGQIYQFKLQAKNALGEVIHGSVVSGIPMDSPSPFGAVSQSSPTALQISWTAVAGANSYQVEYGRGGLSELLTTTQTFALLENLNEGVYTLKLKAVNQGGALEGIETLQRVLGPFHLSPPLIDGGAGALALSFSASEGASSYACLYGTSSADTSISCASSPCVVTGLSPGVPYVFQMEAMGPQNGRLLSNQVQGSALARPVLSFTPSIFQATAAWTSAGAGANYSVFLGPSSGVYGSQGFSGTSPMTLTGLMAETPYFSKVRATNDFGSLDSEEVSFSTLPDTRLILDMPTVSQAGALDFTFLKGAAITSTLLRYGLTSGSYTQTAVCQTSPCTVSGLTPGQTYYFLLEGADNASATFQSEEIAASPVSAPLVLTKAQVNRSDLTLTWSSVSGATGYRVRYGSSSGSLSSMQPFSGLSGTLTGLTVGGTLFFRVEAVHTMGVVSSAEDTLPLVGNFVLSPLTLTAPGSLTLAWSMPLLGTETSVLYGTSASDQQTAASGCSTSPCTVSGLTAGTTYFFKVESRNVSGGLNETAVVSGTPLSLPTLSLAANPSGVTASMPSLIDGVTYILRYGTTSAVYPNSVPVTGASVTVSDLTVAVPYFFVLEASNAHGSLSSLEQSATPTGDISLALNAPTIVSAQALRFTFQKGNGIPSVTLKKGTSPTAILMLCSLQGLNHQKHAFFERNLGFYAAS